MKEKEKNDTRVKCYWKEGAYKAPVEIQYRISGTFDGDFNLAVWRICLQSPN